MTLSEFTVENLRKAIAIYLKAAYPSGVIPPHVRARSQIKGDSIAEVLAQGHFEKVFSSLAPNRIDRYLLRLGNCRYPHMKLGLVRCSDSEDFVFMVDTHHAHIADSPVVEESAEFQQVIALNNSLKEKIEKEWLEEGLPCILQVLDSQVPCAEAPKGKTILVVDDEPRVLELIKRLLEASGYQVVTAGSGADALAQADEAPVDLCLLDIMMPELDGHQVARVLKEKRRFPIVFVSALAPESVSLEFGDGYVRKPFQPDHLLNEIKTRLG